MGVRGEKTKVFTHHSHTSWLYLRVHTLEFDLRRSTASRGPPKEGDRHWWRTVERRPATGSCIARLSTGDPANHEPERCGSLLLISLWSVCAEPSDRFTSSVVNNDSRHDLTACEVARAKRVDEACVPQHRSTRNRTFFPPEVCVDSSRHLAGYYGCSLWINVSILVDAYDSSTTERVGDPQIPSCAQNVAGTYDSGGLLS